MCQRFIDDFTNKITEKLYLEIADAKELKRIMEILLKRRNNSKKELEKEVATDEYKIKGEDNGIRIDYKNFYLFTVYYHRNSKTNYAFHSSREYLSRDITKQEILEYADNIIVSKEVYNIFLSKLKLVEELDSLNF